MDGFYIAYLTGTAGNSLGVFTFQNGILAGADVGGIAYDGDFNIDEHKNQIAGTIKYTVPAGASLITGFSTPVAMEFSFPFTLPINFSSGNVVRIDTPNGPINAKFQKIRGA